MRKILIIDDNKYTKIALSLLVEESGFEPITAHDGGTGLENIKSETPALILLDKKLPDCDGISLLKEIKLYDPYIPVIMLTAYSDLEYAENAIKSGAYAFINKPFNNDEIVSLIKSAVN